MNCKKCKKPLHTYKLLTDKGVESIDLCAVKRAVAKKEINSEEFMTKLENYINSKINKLVIKM